MNASRNDRFIYKRNVLTMIDSFGSCVLMTTKSCERFRKCNFCNNNNLWFSSIVCFFLHHTENVKVCTVLICLLFFFWVLIFKTKAKTNDIKYPHNFFLYNVFLVKLLKKILVYYFQLKKKFILNATKFLLNNFEIISVTFERCYVEWKLFREC